MRSVRVVSMLALFTLGACGSMTDTQHTLLGEESTSPFSQIQPGLSNFDTETARDKADAKWWDNFYGR